MEVAQRVSMSHRDGLEKLGEWNIPKNIPDTKGYESFQDGPKVGSSGQPDQTFSPGAFAVCVPPFDAGRDDLHRQLAGDAFTVQLPWLKA